MSMPRQPQRQKQQPKAMLVGKGQQLTAREYQLLQVLMRNRNNAVSTRQLTEQALGTFYDPSSRQVEALVFQLRKKLGPAVIADRPGYGYVFEEQGSIA